MSDRMAESAGLARRHWPIAARHLGCSPILEPVEAVGGRLAKLLDAGTGVDYFAVASSGALVPISTRTHVQRDGADKFSGWTQRYRRARAECEHFRLAAAVATPGAIYPRVHVEWYFDLNGTVRVYAARTKDLVKWCLAQRRRLSDDELRRCHLLRANTEEAETVLFFAPSDANLRSVGAPYWVGKWRAHEPDLLDDSTLALDSVKGEATALWTSGTLETA